MTKTDFDRIPESGAAPEWIREQLQNITSDDVAWQEGRTWSLMYYLNDAHVDVVTDAYNRFLSNNYLNPFAFKSLQKLERAIIAMVSELFNGDSEVCGAFSSGGTESIFLALYTYREWAKATRPGITRPEVVVPVSIHPAFNKAAHILGLRLRKVDVTDKLTANPEAMRKAIGRNTILIAASAPSYPHGICDPIGDIASIARQHKLPFHVDGCIGGFMLPWVERLGFPVPEWDFRIKGVTSISADLHKFGYAAKGASVILYKNKDFFKHQIFVETEWPGGIYASSTMLGSRSGGPIAAAWASLQHLGKSGYIEAARTIMQGVQQLKEGIEAIPELEFLGAPVMNIISYRTKGNSPDIYVIAEQLENKGWMIDRQQSPKCIHLTVMTYNIPAIPKYLEDLKTAVQYAREHPEAADSGTAALYGLMTRLPTRGLVKKNVRNMMLGIYEDSDDSDAENASVMSSPPKWMIALNRILRVFRR